MKQTLQFFLLSATFFCCTNVALSQVPGTLDSSFANNGVKILKPSTGFDNAYSVEILEDGKMLIGGASEVSGPGNWDAVVYRLNDNGNIDNTFGNNGFAYYDYQGYSQYVRSMKRLSNGKLLFVGGAEANFQVDVFVTQLNEDGTPDASFGDNGTLMIPISSGEDIALAVKEQPDGKLVVVGNCSFNGYTYLNSFALRLNTNGSLDLTYGNNGIAIIDAGYDYESAEDVLLMDDGGILAAGHVENNSDDYAILTFKLNSSGQLDNNYGNNGIAVYDLSNDDDMAYAILRSPADNKILLGGKIGAPNYESDFLVMALTDAGIIDSSFGTNGISILNLKPIDAGLDLTVQTNGKLVLGGTAGSGFAANDFALCRFNQDGTIDSTFGTNGSTLSEISTFFSEIESIALQADGKIVAVGIAASSNNNMGVVRYKGDEVVATGSAALNFKHDEIKLNIYPNPSNGNFCIALNDATHYSGQVNAQLFNLQGQKVYEGQLEMHDGLLKESLNVSKFVTSDVYFLKIFIGANAYCSSMVIQD
ncbi:MAG: T9SS type A sorting domain-containing protein [Chitinophagaceae bacterium]|nr:T9SS type A sorting domain-containing protein [Chitinophagaceae bacterium]